MRSMKSSAGSSFRLGVIGADSSHLPEFARRIKAIADDGRTACRVTGLWTDGHHGMPESEVAGWIEEATALGARPAGSLDELLASVDGVMVLAVDGHRHLELAAPALKRGLPTYIDKPLACDRVSAQALLRLVRENGGRCYSASSLRFAAEPRALERERLGPLVAIDAYGPGELNAAMPGLFFYGVHTIEMVDAIWGPGVKRVSAVTSNARDLVDLDYHDGRYARLRMERRGAYTFGATVHGQRGVSSFQVDFSQVYNRLVQGLVHFFEGGAPPVDLRDIVENVAVMEAGNASMASDGAWIDVPAT